MALKVDECIANKYYIRAKIDDGGEGVVYAVQHVDGRWYALKASRGSRSLRREYHAYRRLGCTQHDRYCLPRIYHYSTHGEHSVMVMSRFEYSLESLRKRNGGKFSMSTVLKIGSKVTRMLQYIHSKGVLHGDLKPSNIMLLEENNRLVRFHLVDFGCSHTYLLDDSKHIADSSASFYGTTLFAPLRAHAQKVQSRRDDLKSLTYMLVYLAKGTLPWRRAADDQVAQMKRDISLSTLCSGTRGLSQYARNVWKLSFTQKPDYAALMSILDSALIELRRTVRVRYDWE